MPGFPQLVNGYIRLFKSPGDNKTAVPVAHTNDAGRDYESDGGRGPIPPAWEKK